MVKEGKMKIISVSSEVSPFSKAGGLADVARSLPKALKKMGHSVLIITPLYKSINREKHNLKMVFKDVDVYLETGEVVKVNFWKTYLMKNLPVYFVESRDYFGKYKNLYGSGYDNARFLVFDVAALKLISMLNFKPDIIQCHDWHSGLIPYLLKNNFRYGRNLDKVKTVFTIHNLVFQLGKNWWEVEIDKKDFGRSRLPSLSSPELENINFAKRAILSADLVNTVSEQYKEEIMTRKFGQDLDRILRNRRDKLFGIVNGIDYKSYSPKNDPGLFRNYDSKSVKNRRFNKEFLQKKFGFEVDPQRPLLCSTSRVTFQKGFELILEVLTNLLRMNAQLIFMGDGDKKYINQLKKTSRRFPGQLVWLPFAENSNLETMLYAGCDMFILPSHHEPCGINQLIAMRYGCVPIVRRVGGLQDTVIDYNPLNKTGNGFSFDRFNKLSFFGAVIRALENYKYEKDWLELSTRIMRESNSWEIPARKYLELYNKALNFEKKEDVNIS